MTSKVAIYLRVSTSDQSTELQRSELLAYCKARGFNDVEIYEDIGRTGTNDNRPALKKLIADAKQRKFDIVICWKIDRLFRSLKHLILTLQEFDELGIKFISLKDQIDLTTSSGRLLMQIIGAMGEFEAALIKERVKAGLNNAKAKGVILGRRRVFEKDQVLELRASGKTIRQIANELHISKSTVATALSNKPPSKLQ
ncbi:MAG: helix-turn-helix domain-containing protein [Deltaproteobacteria bacterium]|nr:helix-turn-helix domain-containing protein [Deltaproteobacteria bacterium]